jgi:hypothetical protein
MHWLCVCLVVSSKIPFRYLSVRKSKCLFLKTLIFFFFSSCRLNKFISTSFSAPSMEWCSNHYFWRPITLAAPRMESYFLHLTLVPFRHDRWLRFNIIAFVQMIFKCRKELCLQNGIVNVVEKLFVQPNPHVLFC